MSIPFTKMHGLGNDFIVVAHFEDLPQDVDILARKMCDRNFGIGADGLVFILPSADADLRMRIINADGTEADQCGNALRCVAKYGFEHDMVHSREITVQTEAGVKHAWLEINDQQQVEQVKVDMGEPILEGTQIPVTIEKNPVVHAPLEVAGQLFYITAVSMGNPHAVIFVKDALDFPVEKWGPLIEQHALFPKKANVEFITMLSPSEMNFRVWERGVGQTLACGTGACAAVVAAILNDQAERKVLVHLKGGDLQIEWNQADHHVYMTGAANQVFEGNWLNG